MVSVSYYYAVAWRNNRSIHHRNIRLASTRDSHSHSMASVHWCLSVKWAMFWNQSWSSHKFRGECRANSRTNKGFWRFHPTAFGGGGSGASIMDCAALCNAWCCATWPVIERPVIGHRAPSRAPTIPRHSIIASPKNWRRLPLDRRSMLSSKDIDNSSRTLIERLVDRIFRGISPTGRRSELHRTFLTLKDAKRWETAQKRPSIWGPFVSRPTSRSGATCRNGWQAPPK